MTENRLLATWLRPLVGLFALAGMLALTACGGGSGAPNNPYQPTGPLTVLPAAATVYSGAPSTLSVTGGTPPYVAFSSDTSVLPVSLGASANTIVLLPAAVAADTAVTVTVRDAIGQTALAAITVRPAPLLNGLIVTPSSAACGANAVCSGQTATAAVTVIGPGGGGIPNRPVRFDVVSGDYAIQTSNPGLPLASTLTVVSDANGLAQVVIKAAVNAFTQLALIRATDLTTGNQVTGQFTIVQTIDGSAVLSVIPATATITGASSTACSSGFRIDYFIYGGTPPYRVTSTFPTAVTLVNSTVTTSGGFFEVITNGTCVDPLVFSIFDAVGLQTTAELRNLLGTDPAPPPPPSPVVIIPETKGSSTTPVASCTIASGFDFVISGGTPPYSVTTPGGQANPNPVTTSGGLVKITYASAPSAGGTPVVVVDGSTPPLTKIATIFCP